MSKSLDGVLTKKANQQETFTEKQVEDLMKCMDPDTGYLHFAKHFAHIQHPVQGKLMFDPYEYQLGLMHSYHNYRFNINMMPRQTGKTTCASIYLAWYAMFNADQTILIAAHKYTGAQEIMQRIDTYMNYVQIILGQVLPTTTKVVLNLKMDHVL